MRRCGVLKQHSELAAAGSATANLMTPRICQGGADAAFGKQPCESAAVEKGNGEPLRLPWHFRCRSKAERSIVVALLRTHRTTRNGRLGGHGCSHARCCCYQEVQKDTAASAKSASKTWRQSGSNRLARLGTKRSGRLTDCPSRDCSARPAGPGHMFPRRVDHIVSHDHDWSGFAPSRAVITKMLAIPDVGKSGVPRASGNDDIRGSKGGKPMH